MISVFFPGKKLSLLSSSPAKDAFAFASPPVFNPKRRGEQKTKEGGKRGGKVYFSLVRAHPRGMEKGETEDKEEVILRTEEKERAKAKGESF